MLNTRTQAQFYKTCTKPHIDYCLLVWAYCGQKKLNHIICRDKQIITNCRCVNIEKSDFKQFYLAKFYGLVVLSVARLPTCILRILVQTYLYSVKLAKLSMRAIFANKSYITLSKKSCDNCFLYTAPKLWNSLPNNITSQCNVNSFNTYLFKYVLTATV